MRFQRMLCLLSDFSLCLYLAFSAGSFNVSADSLPVSGRLMDFDEAAATFGSSFPVRYMDNTGVYHDTIATLQANHNTQYKISNMNGYTDSQGYLQLQRRFLQYSFSVSGSLNQQPQNLTLYIQPEYSIFDTEFIYTCIAVSSGSSGTSTNISAYNSPSWDWVWSGQSVTFSPSLLATNNVLPHLNFYEEGYTVFDFVPAYMDSQALTSGYSVSSTWDHVYASGGKVDILIGLPYVSADASGATGTPTTTAATTTQNINVNVDVDLEETNGILHTISSGISSIVSGILGGIRDFFVPSHEDITSFFSDLHDILYDKIGPVEDAVNAWDYIFTTITLWDNTSETYVKIDPVSVPVFDGGTSATVKVNLNPTESGVRLIPQEFDNDSVNGLMWALRKIIDIVCTIAVVNMLKRKIDLFLNPNAECIVEDEDDDY